MSIRLSRWTASATLLVAAAGSPPEIRVDRDDLDVAASVRLVPAAATIADRDGDGVVHVTGRADGVRIVVDLGGLALVGGTGAPDALAGIGVVVRGANVTIRNGAIRGFKVGILAEDCPGLLLEDLDLSGNYAARLRSTPEAEDASDWLYPHANDRGEWAAQHGAGAVVRRAREVEIRRVRCHRGQNGILLERVASSRIYDNDCSFLSGWGIAMWRSDGNVICRNSLDFCIRGYSHGVYNRGQDSAGLVMFEQCSDNLVALNSITHGGDGVFGFAGREALGEGADAGVAEDAHRRRGSNDNRFIGNDLSFAAAHGLELTFSFGNEIVGNLLEGNAICGVWGGYGRSTRVEGNVFIGNGGAGYGLERGGVNMEHGQNNLIRGNRFRDEPVGARFWTDEDAHLRELPWMRANGMGAVANVVEGNVFTRVAAPVELLAARATRIAGNRFVGCPVELVERDSVATEFVRAEGDGGDPGDSPDLPEPLRKEELLARDAAAAALRGIDLPGERLAVGARAHLRGRHRIRMEEYGPYGWERPAVFRVAAADGAGPARLRFEACGFGKVEGVALTGRGPLLAGILEDGTTIEVASRERGVVAPFRLAVRGTDREGQRTKAEIDGVLASGDWSVRFFALDADGARLDAVPDPAAFRARAAGADEPERAFETIDFDFRGRAPAEALGLADERLLRLGASRFGVVARTVMRFAPGRYRVLVTSDDGVRLRLDGRTVVERWDIHGPTTDVHEFEAAGLDPVEIDLEYFQNDGASTLRIRFEHVGELPSAGAPAKAPRPR